MELEQTEAEIGAMPNGSEVLSIYAENDIDLPGRAHVFRRSGGWEAACLSPQMPRWSHLRFGPR